MTSENLFFVIFLWFSFGFQHSFFAQKYVKNIVGIFLGQNFLKFGYRFVYFLSQCFIFPIFMYFVMSVEPGYCGQKFHEQTAERVEIYRKSYPDKVIEVDGGVDPSNSPGLVKAGADLLVAGSAIFGADDPVKVINAMKRS